MPDNDEIGADEEIRRRQILLQVHEWVEQVGLGSDVER